MGLTLFFVQLFLKRYQQIRPTDVPRDHWAHRAVAVLFQEGILHGYPTTPNDNISRSQGKLSDNEFVKTSIERLISEKLFISYPDGQYRLTRPRSKYEEAVSIYAVCFSFLSMEYRSHFANKLLIEEIPILLRLIGLRKPELVRYGVDVPTTLRELTYLRNQLSQPLKFRG